MPILGFEDFRGGLDVRPAAALARTNILRVLKNAYVTTGMSIKKRPCLNKIATLETGTVGLKAFSGKLQTFYGDGAAITHADTRFTPNRVPNPADGTAPTLIHWADQFNALLYVAAEYSDGTVKHHYLDDPGVWVTATAYAVGVFRRPTTANGFRYEVTAIAGTGTTGATEPTWPTTISSTVVDNAGANQITWTCRGFEVTDTNCPQTKQVAKQAQKIYAAGTGLDTVRYCATGAPRDWTTVSDAGFLPVGLYSTGSDQVTAIAPFAKSSLAVQFADNSQLWTVDPDPALMALTDSIDGIGTLYAHGGGPVSRDLFFPAQNGFRSMSLIALTNNLQDNDVGSAIDAVVQPSFATSDEPLGLFYPKLGQYWSINGTNVWAYSFSRTAKLSAWSQFTFQVTIDDACVLNQELYVRSGDDVYKVDGSVYKDGTSDIPLVDVQMFYQDAKAPGVMKQWTGFDFIGTGTPTVSFLFDASNQTLESQAYVYPAVTEPGALYPVELMSTRIAPHFTHQLDEAFEISLALLYFEKLGVV